MPDEAPVMMMVWFLSMGARCS